MSARLAVVLSQSNAAGHRGTTEEQLVGQMIGQPGIDMSLIGDLRSLGRNETDQLVLDGLNSDFAILHWGDSAEVMRQLGDANVPGQRAPHSGDAAAPTIGGLPVVGFSPRATDQRKVFCVSMDHLGGASEIIAVVYRILEERQQKYLAASKDADSNPTPVTESKEVAALPTENRPIDRMEIDDEDALERLVSDVNDEEFGFNP
ncbi:MAG: hypothetical protein AAFP90_12665 [Planctomycetota bacterium]